MKNFVHLQSLLNNDLGHCMIVETTFGSFDTFSKFENRLQKNFDQIDFSKSYSIEFCDSKVISVVFLFFNFFQDDNLPIIFSL